MTFIVRTLAKDAIGTVLSARPALTTVSTNTGHAPQITRDIDGPWQSGERIVIADVEGETDIPSIRSGAKTIDDEFTIDLYVTVSIPGQSIAQQETRCAELVEDIVTALGLTANLAGTVPGLYTATPTLTSGPNTYLTDVRGVNTSTAVAALTVTCKSRVNP